MLPVIALFLVVVTAWKTMSSRRLEGSVRRSTRAGSRSLQPTIGLGLFGSPAAPRSHPPSQHEARPRRMDTISGRSTPKWPGTSTTPSSAAGSASARWRLSLRAARAVTTAGVGGRRTPGPRRRALREHGTASTRDHQPSGPRDCTTHRSPMGAVMPPMICFGADSAACELRSRRSPSA